MFGAMIMANIVTPHISTYLDVRIQEVFITLHYFTCGLYFTSPYINVPVQHITLSHTHLQQVTAEVPNS